MAIWDGLKLIHGIPMCSMHFPSKFQVVFAMFVVQSVFAFPVVSGQGIQVGTPFDT